MTERVVTINEWEQLKDLPHGAVVLAGNERIVMNREDGPDPFFDCEGGGWLRPNNVWAEFNVETVIVLDDADRD